jgi:hypothetical protein
MMSVARHSSGDLAYVGFIILPTAITVLYPEVLGMRPVILFSPKLAAFKALCRYFVH